ncbi:FtsQ-type POTRA domain-containing protein [Sandarakinorhabdus sp.]|uniref:cell division protein FtsQ/DivIB n=1 Tax=Sandarakinorhabdus sp. TaxID=1916663 RepID=UPI00286E0AA4|nr:FtsQ-type POTRA domain-containing protein [Sandarakinorhabdus sp.]
MTAAVLKRGAAAPRPKKRAAPQPARITLPVGATVLRRRVVIAVLALALLAAGVIAALAGVPQRMGRDFVLWTAASGYEVRHVEVHGTREQPRLAVYEAVLTGTSNAMLAADLEAIRTRLKALDWVADASVGRRLPDTLVIDITERRPVALWQYKQRLAAIDLTGKPLTTQGLVRFNDLPIVIGPGANLRVREALALMADSPLAKDVDAAVLVGGRRWDLKFKTGETLALPDTPQAAARALKTFARLDSQGSDRLLGGRFVRFDMRLPGRMVVAGPAVAEQLAAQSKAAAEQARASAAAKDI